MSETISFTDVGEGIHEGKLVKWLVSEGQTIKEDQPLCEIETDKAIVEIPSSKTGTVLKLHGQVGETMHVGNPLVTVGQPGEKLSEFKEAAGASKLESSAPSSVSSSAASSQIAPTLSASGSTSVPSFSAPTSSSGTPKATPAVRKLAQSLGVDLSRVAASGPGGFISESNVKAAASSGNLQAPGASVSSAGASNVLAPSQPVMSASVLSTPTNAALIKATPSVRKLAFQLGVDLARVVPSGPNGHIVDQDVRNAKNPVSSTSSSSAMTPNSPSSLASSSSSPSSLGQPVSSLPARRIHVVSKAGGTEIRKPFSPIRRTISERLQWSASWPTVTHVDEVDVTELWALREKEKGRADDKGVKLTLLPFVVKAVVKALVEFPDFNAALDEDAGEVVLKKYYDLGIAVDTPAGLMVPVLKDVDKKSVFDIAKDIQLLSTKARERSLKADEITGGTFTLTNIGSVGGLYATPLINPPEAAILGVMRMQTRPAFAPQKIEKKASAKSSKFATAKTVPKVEARQFLPLCLTFDHRLNDGAVAAAFVLEIKKHLENPEGLLVGDI